MAGPKMPKSLAQQIAEAEGHTPRGNLVVSCLYVDSNILY